MTPRSGTRDDWADRVAALEGTGSSSGNDRKPPITVERIVAAALVLIEAEGFDALTMRRVAAALDTGPASLYAHVRNKAELDDLLIGELCSRIDIPKPDGRRWRAQVHDVCAQLRDQYLAYPGVAQAALAIMPTSLETLRINEGLLSILLAGGVGAQDAAWAIDAVFLVVTASSLETALQQTPEGRDARELDRDETAERLRMLPTERFPNTVKHAAELTAGSGNERLDFAINLLLNGLKAPGR
jgi:AcrR family transcriptional regulator